MKDAQNELSVGEEVRTTRICFNSFREFMMDEFFFRFPTGTRAAFSTAGLFVCTAVSWRMRFGGGVPTF